MTRFAGCKLWSDDCAPLVEVKIIGFKTDPRSQKKKIFVWKNYKAGPKPIWISADNLAKHAPDLIDPPKGTEGRWPPVGDLGDPSSFSGDFKDIKPISGTEPPKEVGDVWFPSGEMAAYAKKLLAKGVKPQDTFSKAVAAGEPLPTKFPDPVAIDDLPKAEPPAPAPAPPAPEPPKAEPPPPPEPEPEPPKAPEPPPAPTGPAAELHDATKSVEWGKDHTHENVELNGVKLAPGKDKYWEDHEDVDLGEPEFKIAAGKKGAAGCIVMEPDGRVWVVSPSGHFGGLTNTFPKGKTEKGLSLQQNAMKEAFEESGLQVELTGHLGDFTGYTSTTRYYLAKRTGGAPWSTDYETEGVKLVPPEKLDELFTTKNAHGGWDLTNVKRDKEVAKALLAHLQGKKAKKEPEAEHGLTDEEFDKAVSAGDADKLVLAAPTLGIAHYSKITAQIQNHAEAGDFEAAAKLAEAHASIAEIQGKSEGLVNYWKDSAADFKKSAAEKAKPQPTPTPEPHTPVDLEEASDLGIDIYDWNPDPDEGYQPPTKEEAYNSTKALGLDEGEFCHPVTGEVMKVAELPEGAYVDPIAGLVIKDGETVQTKIVPTGKASPSVDTSAHPKGVSETFPEPVSLPPPVVAPPAPPDAKEILKAIKLPPGLPKLSKLKIVGSAKHLGGGGDKNEYVDKDTGKKYLHKIAKVISTGKPAPERAVAQHVWSTIAQKVLKDQVPIGVAVIKGVVGSIQPLLEVDKSKPDLKGNHPPPEDLSPEDRTSIAQTHVLDWMMSMHDAHGANFLRTKEGKLVSIDKEQAFKYFASDQLGTDYHPNGQYGEHEPYYNVLWRGFAEGKYEMDMKAVKKVIDDVQDIPTKDYVAMLRPFAELKWPGKPEEQRDFLKKARRRKLELRKDFERLLTNLHQKRTGETGTFTFDGGWKVPGAAVTTKFSSADYMQKFSSSHGGLVIKATAHPDDPNIICLKTPQSDLSGVEKLKKLVEHLGVTPTNATPVTGTYYAKFLIKKEDWDKAEVSVTEMPSAAVSIKPTPEKPRYFPHDWEPIEAKDNAKDLDDLHNMALGISGKRFASDGPNVEGSLTRVRKWKDVHGEYYAVNFKLRKHKWKSITGGTKSTLGFPQGKWNEAAGHYEETGAGTLDTVPSTKWSVGKSEIHLVKDHHEDPTSRREDKAAFVGMVQAKLRPKAGQTPKQALEELLDEMEPGFAKECLRDPTPEEKETWKLSQMLWAHSPQVSDKLKEEDRTPAKLRQALADAGITEEDINNTTFEEVLPGHSAHIQKGRWKKMRDAGAYFVFHGVSVNNLPSIVRRGCMGINERHAAGLGKTGVSPEGDTITGSGDGVLAYVAHKHHKSEHPHSYLFSKEIQVILDPRSLDRLDTYLHYGDMWGTCTEYSNSHKPAHVWNDRRPVEQQVKDLTNKTHEISFRRGVAPDKILRFTCSSTAHREDAIKNLRAAGIEEINGVPLEDMFVYGKTNQEVYDKYVSPLMEEQVRYA